MEIVDEYCCPMPINIGVSLFRQEAEDLTVLADGKSVSQRQIQLADLKLRKLHLHCFPILGTGIGKTLPAQYALAFTDDSGEPSVSVVSLAKDYPAADLFCGYLLTALPPIPLGIILKLKIPGKIAFFIHFC